MAIEDLSPDEARAFRISVVTPRNRWSNAIRSRPRANGIRS
jgi:hypothetical protein